MRCLCESRAFVSFLLASAVGLYGFRFHPFPGEHPLLALIRIQEPTVFQALRWTYAVLWFSTPFWIGFIALSAVWVFLLRRQAKASRGRLPAYPDPARRDKLYLIVGELHHPVRPEPAADPRWLLLPERGLFTGIAVFGATGSGKTSACMRPFAEQLLAYRADDEDSRLSALALEVKGDFCRQIREILQRHGRAGDYLEIRLDGDCRYNPLHNDLEPYAQAYAVASLLTNLFGRGKEPFWQQAYTNLVKFIIQLHRVLDDYVTLFDVYRGAVDPDRLQALIRRGRARFAESALLVPAQACLDHPELDRLDFEQAEGGLQRTPAEPEARELLRRLGVAFQEKAVEADDPEERDRRERFRAVERWFEHDWMRIESKLRTSIVEGVSVFLSLFDDNPAVKRTFCPPKECYDPEANADGRYGQPLPPFSELIERGKVLALNFPVSANPGLARAVGVFLKQDFQRAMMDRIPCMAAEPDRAWRPVLFLCDEYHAFATVGEDNPTGDEKFFALSRQAKCIPVVATQSLSSLRSALPGETWRTLLQTFRTKIFLALADDFSAKAASELCGREEQLRPQYSLSEAGQDSRVSLLGGRSVARRATVSAGRSYHFARQPVFEPKAFAELQNAQAVALAYDGFNPLPPTLCYLKPHYLDPDRSYFEQRERGEI